MRPEIAARIAQIRRGEVPRGYRKTKLGVTPSEWEIVPFQRMFSQLRRKNAVGNRNVLTISAQYGLIAQEDFFSKSVASENTEHYFLLERGDFAYNKSYSNGYPFGALKPLTRYESGIVSPLYICFTPTAVNRCPEYYAQYFDAGMMNREIEAFAQEGARNHGLLNVSIADFFNTRLLCPPPEEQRRIADVLSAQDSVIALKEHLIAEKTRQKRYLMQQYLTGKRRLPGFDGEWKSVSVDNCIEEYKQLSNDVASIPVYSSSRKGLMPQSEYYDKKEAVKTNLGYKVVPPGYATYRHMSDDDIFHFNINETGGKILVSVEYPVFTASEICNLRFLIPSLNETARFRYFCRTQKLGGTRTRLYLSNLVKYRLKLPPIAEQNAIAEILSAADRELELLRRSLELERRQKTALAQLLLTGLVHPS